MSRRASGKPGGVAIDTSALLAIALAEPEAPAIEALLFTCQPRMISAVSVLEAACVLEARKGLAGSLLLDELCRALGLEVVGFAPRQVRLARDAWARFGKGRHPAALNFGDCCAYALARFAGLPLLCKGNDFPRTDLELASY
jgi:ribonuclease VapC